MLTSDATRQNVEMYRALTGPIKHRKNNKYWHTKSSGLIFFVRMINGQIQLTPEISMIHRLIKTLPNQSTAK